MVTDLLRKALGRPQEKLPVTAPTKTQPEKAVEDKAALLENLKSSIAAKDALGKNLHAEQASPEGYGIYKGDPENQVLIFDMDETLVAGDKVPITEKREQEINAMGDRQVDTIKKGDALNKLPFDIKYVLRPGAKELLEYLTSRGYKIIVSTRNYQGYAEAICKHNPILAKYVSGTLGREDLQTAENKDFKKYPNHPDNYGFFKKMGCTLYNIFIYGPQYLFYKFKSLFSSKNVRWNPSCGTLGKYPPNMIELLKVHGNTKLQGLEPPRFLIDNKATRELRDSKKSGDFAVINPDVDANGDGKPEDFQATSPTQKVKIKHKETGEEIDAYLWVKNVIEGIERGWKEQFKRTAGKEPKTTVA
jgi:hypothetical protein